MIIIIMVIMNTRKMSKNANVVKDFLGFFGSHSANFVMDYDDNH